MPAFFAIVWFLWLIVSLGLVFHFIGFSGIVSMFPEGRRWWHLPVQISTLVNFSVMILSNPWN